MAGQSVHRVCGDWPSAEVPVKGQAFFSTLPVHSTMMLQCVMPLGGWEDRSLTQFAPLSFASPSVSAQLPPTRSSHLKGSSHREAQQRQHLASRVTL